MTELKCIPDCEGYYAGSDGSIYSSWVSGSYPYIDPNKRKKLSPSKRGKYYGVYIKENGQLRSFDVHVLIARAFIGSRPDGLTVSHKDGNSFNNNSDNLLYESYSDNLNRRNDHGTHDRGVNNSRSVFTESDVMKIVELRNSGLTQQQIADMFNVTRTSILRIVNGKRYNDTTGIGKNPQRV